LVAGLLVVADREGNLYGLDPQTGEQRWSQALAQQVLADLGVDRANSTIYVATRGKGLFRVDPRREGRYELVPIGSKP